MVGAAVVGLGALFSASEAKAAGDGWGLHSGETMAAKSLMPYIEAGWPDVSLGVTYGISDKLDIGARLGAVYGPSFNPSGTTFGMALSVPIRISLAKGGGVNALLHVDPGLKFSQFSTPLLMGAMLPIGAEVGIPVADHATVQIGLDVPVYLNFTQAVFVNFAPMAGPGFEYHIGNMAVGLNTRFGATVAAGGSGVAWGTGFGFLTQAYFGYKI
jgi:hypothetical protein